MRSKRDVDSVLAAVRPVHRMCCSSRRMPAHFMHQIATEGACYLQFQEDKSRPAEQQEWRRCDICKDGVDVVICLSKRSMLETAARRGRGEPLYMDATHGLQKYGLKLVTIHVKDEEDKGMSTH